MAPKHEPTTLFGYPLRNSNHFHLWRKTHCIKPTERWYISLQHGLFLENNQRRFWLHVSGILCHSEFRIYPFPTCMEVIPGCTLWLTSQVLFLRGNTQVSLIQTDTFVVFIICMAWQESTYDQRLFDLRT